MNSPPSGTSAEIQRLVRAAMLSPTSFNLQHWRFIVLVDRSLRQRVRDSSSATRIRDETVLLALVGHLDAWEQAPVYAAHLGPEMQRQAAGKSHAVYGDQPLAQRDEALRSCGLALQTLTDAARERNWSCRALWPREPEALSHHLGLDDRFVLAAVVALDRANTDANTDVCDADHQPRIFRNGFADPWQGSVPHLLERRRAIKYFDPSYRIAPCEVRELLAGTLAVPGAFGPQPARFIWVDDVELRRRIHPFAYRQPQILEASGLAVVCGQLRTPPPPVPADSSGRDTMGGQCDHWAQRDQVMVCCAMAAQRLMLAATAHGYDSCPMIGFDFSAVANMLSIPSDHVLAMMVALGRRAHDPPPRGSRLTLGEVLFTDQLGRCE